MERKAILREVHKVRLDVERGGAITPVCLRLEPGDPTIHVTAVEHVDDRHSEVWYEVRTREGDLLTLRLRRETLEVQLHTVETLEPGRWSNWDDPKTGGDG